jgi:hypothetical protein
MLFTSSKVSTANQDMARAVALPTVGASASSFNNNGAVVALLCSHQRPAKAASSSSWLALRAGVLRRAVSPTTRPMLRWHPPSVTVGREALQHLCGVQPKAGLRVFSSQFNPKSLVNATAPGNANLHRANTLRPNHSLNRTHCGMRLKARHFILGL